MFVYVHVIIRIILCIYIHTYMHACMHTYIHTYVPYHTIPYHTIPYHTIPYHTIPYHTIPYHTIPYHTIPYHTIPYHTIPTYIHTYTHTHTHIYIYIYTVNIQVWTLHLPQVPWFDPTSVCRHLAQASFQVRVRRVLTSVFSHPVTGSPSGLCGRGRPWFVTLGCFQPPALLDIQCPTCSRDILWHHCVTNSCCVWGVCEED